MNSRKDGSSEYPHTEADETFNNLMFERDRVDELPRSIAKVAFRSDLVELAHPDAPAPEVVGQAEVNEQLLSAS